MADQTIPNTENQIVATLAIAWEIARISYNNAALPPKDKVRELTNAVIQSYQAISQKTPIEKPSN
ncbi:MAG: hypothetical protein EHM40_03425 [Chloroflexi bacterium]|nr:MAG: hypothetical protein EHM40_03425 [Chloroflexota bacterium]